MAASKLVIFSLFFALILTAADVSIQGEDVPPLTASDAVDSSPLKIELDQLKSKIRSLGLHFFFFFYLYFYSFDFKSCVKRKKYKYGKLF